MTDYSFEATSNMLDTPSGQLHYHEAGEGPALLLLHGSGPGVTGWANFEGNLPFFAKNFRCIIIDFPGYGLTYPVEGDPMAACFGAVVQILDGLGIDKAHIIGNSLGGIIGAGVAANMPDRVGKLVSIGGIGLNLFSSFPAEGLNLLIDFAEDPTKDKLVRWLRSMVFDHAILTDELIEQRFERATEPKTLAATRAIYDRSNMEAMAAGRRSGGAIPVIEHLPKIQAPVLLTWGRDDRVTPLDIGLIPMRLIPNCELHVFPNCGHWAMIEKKVEFESLVEAFLLRGDQ